MDDFDIEFQNEKMYLEKTLEVLERELENELIILDNRKYDLLKARKEMWENTSHHSNDFEKMTEVSQYLSVLESQTASYGEVVKKIDKYKRMIFSPYFGMFNFIEKGSEEAEKIYIGIGNLTDTESLDIMVYDWRAPISSMYYQYELGNISYKAPRSNIEGNMTLKRQYNIKDGELEYYFDSNVKIDDELLQNVLCRNASTKMRNIVETIQKEQDIIIRDTDNELLMVQGVAGSGKTSIALHRIAYLLYYGMDSQLRSNNILIVSPNAVFSKYISDVLPDLGEENVNQITFDELAIKLLGSGNIIEKRSEQLETLITNQCTEEMELRKNCIKFKESEEFLIILNRMLRYYERNMIEFEDIYYDGKIIETKELLKNWFYNDKMKRPMAQRLIRIKNILFNTIHQYQRPRVKKIETIVKTLAGHQFDFKAFSRLVSIKESRMLNNKIDKFTKIDYFEVYEKLFSVEGIFDELIKDIEVPVNIKDIIEFTKDSIKKGNIYYEDCAPLMYLKLMIEGSKEYSNIRQVVIDEAQDYTPIQYEVYGLLFRYSGFTVLGDIHQAIDKNVSISLYDKVDKILNKRSSVQLYLDKSYRSSYEISTFTQQILKLQQDCISFERYEDKPQIIKNTSRTDMINSIYDSIKEFVHLGYKSIAIIGKSMKEAKEIYQGIADLLEVKLIDNEEEIQDGVIVIPAYIAKGLEFDAVLVYNVASNSYNNEFDRKLLYVACTRALHRLRLFYTGDLSSFINI